MMKASQQCYDLIKAFEGIMDGNPDTVLLEPYRDLGGYWTIGWGHLLEDQKNHNISISIEEAEELLKKDVEIVEAGVNSLLEVEVNQNQFDALVSFAYNVGLGAFKNSELLALVNAGDFDGAAEQFKRWNKVNGKVIKGLVRRRESERMLFVRPTVVIGKELINSRTMVGGATAAVGTVVSVTEKLSRSLKDFSNADIVLYVGLIASILALLGVAYVIYARYQDRKNGYR